MMGGNKMCIAKMSQQKKLVKSDWMAFVRFILRIGCIGVAKFLFEFVCVWVIAKLLCGYIQELGALDNSKCLNLKSV
jgi:hypothetical protein